MGAAAKKMEEQQQQKQQQQQQKQQDDQHDDQHDDRHDDLKKIIRRDLTFVCLGLVVSSVMSWIEMNAGVPEMRGQDAADVVDVQKGVIDTGYIVTKPLYDFLKERPFWVDTAALINTIVGVLGPIFYFFYQTVWVGDYEPMFRYGAVSVLRSMCGWFTFLPPDAQYLMSHYDFPDALHCVFQDCGDPDHVDEIAPFVSFFSGHVATIVIAANHMYLHGYKKVGIFLHVFNVFSILRLLATRGHYSIDIIIGWYMAVSVSNPAGRLGRYFSRTGDLRSFEKYLVPSTATEAFESVTGVDSVREQQRMSALMKRKEFQQKLLELAAGAQEDDDLDLVEPTAKLMVEGKLDELLATYMKRTTTTAKATATATTKMKTGPTTKEKET